MDLVVDNLLRCFTFPPTQHTVKQKLNETAKKTEVTNNGNLVNVGLL